MPTSFENLKIAVEKGTGRPLTTAELAQIKYLLPESVFFGWVEGERLVVDVGTSASRRGRRAREKDEEFEKASGLTEEGEKEKPVLLFEFVDGDLRNKGPSLQIGKNKKKTPQGGLAMPVFTSKQMSELCSKRIAKFQLAVHNFLEKCERDGVDPVEKLTAAHKPHIPGEESGSPPGLSRGETSMSVDHPETIPEERGDVVAIVEGIKTAPSYRNQIVPDGEVVFPPREAEYGDLTFRLSQSLVNALYNDKDITRFYRHQTEAINHLHDGEDVIVSTSTSSGKTLIYQVPVLHELENNASARAIYIFPTKALAQDQIRAMKSLLSWMGDSLPAVSVETYDGDTPMEERRRIREEASIIFTNPDMLHLAVLPNEEQWRTFLRNLRFVVVDGRCGLTLI